MQNSPSTPTVIEVSPERIKQLNLSVQDVANYAMHHGWKPVPHRNQRLRVFEGPLDDHGNPFHLVLPGTDDFIDKPLRLADAITMLAVLEDRPPEDILAELQEDQR